jgi:hypothetical protein
MPTKYYPQNTNTDTNCDEIGDATNDHDMSKTVGTSTTHTVDTTGMTSFTLIKTYQLDVSGDSPIFGSQTYNLSISINAISRTDVRFNISSVDRTGCLPGGTSSYSATFTTATTHTFSLTLSFATGDEDLELRVEAQQNSTHGGRSITLDVQDANTWVEAPWPVASATVLRGALHG